MTEGAWAAAERQLRDPQQVVSLSAAAMPWDRAVVEWVADGDFWSVVGRLGITLLVTREYEHLVLALSAVGETPTQSVLRVPHPSGIAVDRAQGSVFIACTRNPNQLMLLKPTAGWLERSDRSGQLDDHVGLAPVVTRFLPGAMYMHDLAFVGGRLLANAVGMNAVIDLSDGRADVVWWPKSVERDGTPVLTRNHVQLNSIAAGASLESSFFTASTDTLDGLFPGDPDWVVDRRGVVHAGDSREVVARGLTRPHSARLDEQGQLWVDDSGYGTVNVVDRSDATTTVAAKLPGWTRGLCLLDGVAFVGTSRVIPRFARYAPGLDVAASQCGIHVVDLASGRRLGGLTWPSGNQIFAVDWVPTTLATGFLAGSPDAAASTIDEAWYRFSPPPSHSITY